MHKTHPGTGHLNAEQIDDHLIGDLAPLAAAHLASCEACTALVAAALEPIADFQAVTQAWSERRSATLPVYVPAASLPQTMGLRIAAGATAAVILMMGITMPAVRHQAAPQTAYATPQPAAQPQALTEIADDEAVMAPQQMRRSQATTRISQDNQMLQDIDAALNNSSERPSLALEPVSAELHQQPGAMSLQD